MRNTQPIFNIPPLKEKTGHVQVLEKKLKENEDLIEEYQLNIKEWDGSHEQKVGELESLISSLRKTISKKAEKLRSKRLERISKILEIKKKMRGKNYSTKGGEDEGNGTKGDKGKDSKGSKGKGGKKTKTYNYNVLKIAREVLRNTR